MDLLNQQLSDYIDSHTSPESKVLDALNRETNAKVLMPRMLSGHLQGRVLSMFSKMIQPRRILEIGTYTGYSALCLSEGLIDNGLLYDWYQWRIEQHGKKVYPRCKYGWKIITHIGNALDIIPQLNEGFDIVFIDADKVNYSRYLTWSWTK